MARQGTDVHNSNPGEELNFHGLPVNVNNAVFGKNYGYPACVAIFDPSNIPNYPGGAKTGDQMISDQKFSFLTDQWCKDTTVTPAITFSSHTAPLDIKFTADGSAALVSFHGSW